MSDLQGHISVYPGDAPDVHDQMDSGTPQETAWPKPPRFLLFALGSCFCVWPFFDPFFRDIENNFTGLLCLSIAIGLGVFVLAAAIGTAWQRSAFLFCLVLVGQAASLQLVNAGWQLRYQHYKPLGEIMSSTQDTLLLGLLVVQAVLVLIGLRRSWTGLLKWFRQNFSIWQLFLIGAFFVVSTTTVSHSIEVYVKEWGFAVLLQTLSLATVILAAISIPHGSIRRISRWLSGFFGSQKSDTDAEPGGIDRFAVSVAAFVMVIAAFLCTYSYEHHPHVPDEVAYLTHARFIAAGALTMPAPPVPQGFEVYLMEVSGSQWYPAPPPGWPLILAFGVFLGIPWMVNPILAGINILLAYVLLRELYSKGTARVSILLLAISPWYIFLGMSLMTHMFTLTCALLAAIGVAWSRRSDKSIWACLGGLALGMMALVRPLEAVAMAGLLGLWAIGLGGRRLKLTAIAGLVAGAMIVGGIGLAYNAALTGNPAEFPINTYTDKYFGKNSNAYGFGPDRGMGWALDPYPGHGPVDALVNTNLNVSAMNTELFGWSIGSFLVIAFGLFLGGFKRSDYLMLAVIAAIYVLHFFYYFSGGPDFAARYWFLMIVPLVVVAARGIRKLAARLDEQFEAGGSRLFVTIAALCVVTVAVFIPWRAIDKYHNFRGMRPDIRHLAEAHGFGRSLVLIQGNKDPDYASAAVHNPLDLQADAPIYAWDRDSETRNRLLEAYPDRSVWIVKSPSLTGRGYIVAAGPLTAADLIKGTETELAGDRF